MSDEQYIEEVESRLNRLRVLRADPNPAVQELLGIYDAQERDREVRADRAFKRWDQRVETLEARLREVEGELATELGNRVSWQEKAVRYGAEKAHAEQRVAAANEQLDNLSEYASEEMLAFRDRIRAALTQPQPAPTPRTEIDPPAKSSVCASGHTWVTAVSDQRPESGTPCHCGAVSWPASKEQSDGR